MDSVDKGHNINIKKFAMTITRRFNVHLEWNMRLSTFYCIKTRTCQYTSIRNKFIMS